MRRLLALALLLLVGAPSSGSAGGVMSGFPALADCTNLADNDVLNGELYAVKVTPVPSSLRTDFLFDVRQKGEGQSDRGTNITPNNWAVDPNWRAGQGARDVHFVVITYDDGQIALDSGDISSASFDAQALQTLGTAFTGLNAIPGTRAPYDIDLGPTTAPFPRGTTSDGIDLAFPILGEGPFEVVPGSGCYIGGALGDPTDTLHRIPTQGAIIGYNVYRIPDDGVITGSVTDFMAALDDGDDATGWQYFLDLRKLRLDTRDAAPVSSGTVSPLETEVFDLAGLQNPDGRAYTGDEVLIFQDNLGNWGRLRCAGCGTLPDLSRAYWYAAQPVMLGKVSDFADVGWTGNANIRGDHRIDLDGDTIFDALSLDTVAPHPAGNTPEFISPQAELGMDGLGLTHAGVLFLTPPMHFDPAIPLAATNQVSLMGAPSGRSIALTLTTGFESGDVIGYDLIRLLGDERVRVNDKPILAQGGESNTYEVSDRTRTGRASARYEVVIRHAAGPDIVAGPFVVAPGRR